MLRRGDILNIKYTTRHKNLAYKHSKKRWWIVSGEWQKLHLVSPFQLHRARLSFVKITPLFRYHKNIFILVGILICHISYDTLTPLLINAVYINLIEKLPDECKAQIKASLSPCKFTSCIEATILSQSLRFLPTKLRRKEMFNGTDASTLATESYFLLTILNNAGNFIFQWLVTQPSVHPKTSLWSVFDFEGSKTPESIFNIHLAFPEVRICGFLVRLARVLSFMYLLLNSSCHSSSSFNNLKIHLLNKHLFCNSKFCIPKPLWIFGWHKISHLASLYLRLC
jgi:hypothetical protein